MRGVRKRLLLGAVGLAVVGAGISLAFALTGSPVLPKPGVVPTSGPLPLVAGQDITGGRFAPGDYRGSPLVLNFWNPYCAPCRGEATVLDVAEGQLSKQAVIVGVLYSNSTFPHDVAAAKRFARDLGERYPTIDDPDHALAQRFAVPGIPTTVIADARGRMRFVVYGALKRGQLEGLVRRVRR